MVTNTKTALSVFFVLGAAALASPNFAFAKDEDLCGRQCLAEMSKDYSAPTQSGWTAFGSSPTRRNPSSQNKGNNR